VTPSISPPPPNDISSMSHLRDDSGVCMQAMEIARLNQHTEFVETSAAQLHQENATLQSMFDAKKNEIYNLTRKASQQSREYTALHNDLTALREKHSNDLRDMATQLDPATKLKEKQEKHVQQVIVNLQHQLADKDSKIDDLNDHYVEVKSQLVDLMNNYEALRAKYQTATTYQTAPPQQLEATQKFALLRIPILEREKEALKNEIDRIKNSHSGSCEDYAALLLGNMAEASLEKEAAEAAEAETEGLRHLRSANEALTTHCSDLTRQVTELSSSHQRAQHRITELEEAMSSDNIEAYLDLGENAVAKPVLGFSRVKSTMWVHPVAFSDNRAEMNAALQKVRIAQSYIEKLQEANTDLQENNAALEAAVLPKQTLDFSYYIETTATVPLAPVKPTLGFSIVAKTIATSPIAPQDNTADLTAATQALRTAELDIETLEGEKCILQHEGAKLVCQNTELRSKLNTSQATNTTLQQEGAKLVLANSELQSEFAAQEKAKFANLGFSSIATLSSTPTAPPPTLSLSGIAAQSTAPAPGLLPPSATAKLSSELFSAFNSLGQQINSLSSPTPPTIKHRPNVAVTINISPSSKRSWSLLKHIQGAISSSSSLDIHGPKPLVQEFVTGMEELEIEHREALDEVKEKAAVSQQLEKVVAELMGEIETLQGELKKRGRCEVASHRNLRDELEAKELQFQMQAQLLADRQRRG
jgi:hypothetical protein